MAHCPKRRGLLHTIIPEVHAGALIKDLSTVQGNTHIPLIAAISYAVFILKYEVTGGTLECLHMIVLRGSTATRTGSFCEQSMIAETPMLSCEIAHGMYFSGDTVLLWCTLKARRPSV